MTASSFFVHRRITERSYVPRSQDNSNGHEALRADYPVMRGQHRRESTSDSRAERRIYVHVGTVGWPRSVATQRLSPALSSLVHRERASSSARS